MSETPLREKVQGLYGLIGERGLYVNSNHDVFIGGHDVIQAGINLNYEFRLLGNDGRAYASPLLFAALTSLLKHGTMLITGAPGIGKTTGAEFAGHFFTGVPLDDILAATIQGHPQQTEEKMIARYHTGDLIKEGKENVLPRKFLTCPVKLIDEISRLDPDKFSIILRLIDTGKAVYGDTLLDSQKGPLFATANYADAGTFSMPPPALDRFDIAVVVTSPQPWDLERIYSRADEKLNGGLAALLEIPEELKLSKENVEQIQTEINDLPMPDDMTAYMNFVLATIRFSEEASNDVTRMTKGNAWKSLEMENARFANHPSTYVKNELSVRTARAWQRYAKALAWFAGKKEVDEESMKTVFPYAVWHKLEPSDKAVQEPWKALNDRIGFAQNLMEKITDEWNTVKEHPVIKTWAAVYEAIKDKDSQPENLRKQVRVTIKKIAEWDNPYALILAKNLESEYNQRMMRK